MSWKDTYEESVKERIARRQNVDKSEIDNSKLKGFDDYKIKKEQKKIKKKPGSILKFQTKLADSIHIPENHTTLLNVVGSTSVDKVGIKTVLATFEIAVNDQQKCQTLLNALSNNPDTSDLFVTKVKENIGKMSQDQVENIIKSVHEVSSDLAPGKYKDDLLDLQKTAIQHAIKADMKINNMPAVKYAIDTLGYDENQTLKAMHKRNMEIDGMSVIDWAINEGRQIDGVSMELETFSQKSNKHEGIEVVGKHTERLRDEARSSSKELGRGG